VRCYTDGAAALAAMRGMTADLLIIGLMLSDISGFEVIEAMRADGAGAQMPILMLSDRSIREEDKRRMSGQVLRIMEKGSFNRGQFLFEVGRALQQRAGGQRH
jgi:CheY-like chemotaxis protein